MINQQVVFLLLATLVICQSATKDQWQTRTIYQLLTDRYARTDGSTQTCNDLGTYCGGTFQGIINKLDYIAGMGFDAIWISPVVSNYRTDYHGYAAKNIYEINGHFGSAQDLQNLVDACHNQDIWVMVDVVANHMGALDENYSEAVPFNNANHYHNFCIISGDDFATKNMHNIQYCRLASLADLNTEDSYVRTTLQEWIHSMVATYGFDGIRIDTVPHVPVDFWKGFTKAAAVYSVGQVFDGDMGYHTSFMAGMDATLNYPFYFTMRDIFANNQDMWGIRDYYINWGTHISETQMTYQANFVDNHDNARWLSSEASGSQNWDEKKKIFKSMTAMTLTSIGIPIVYYGNEQLFTGGNDSLWNAMDTNSEMYKFIALINEAKQQTGASRQPQIQRYVDSQIFAFSRGSMFVALSSKLNEIAVKKITYHPYSAGTQLCNIFNSECLTVNMDGFELTLTKGEVQILIPQTSQITQ